MSEQVDIINPATDTVERVCSLAQAQAENLPRRFIQIFAFDGAGRLLVQQRAPTKAYAPNLLDASVAGSVQSGEGYTAAAMRELQEELDVQGGPQAYRDVHGSWGICRLFTLSLQQTPAHPSSHEVAHLDWLHMDEICYLRRRFCYLLMPGFVTVLDAYLETRNKEDKPHG